MKDLEYIEVPVTRTALAVKVGHIVPGRYTFHVSNADRLTEGDQVALRGPSGWRSGTARVSAGGILDLSSIPFAAEGDALYIIDPP